MPCCCSRLRYSRAASCTPRSEGWVSPCRSPASPWPPPPARCGSLSPHARHSTAGPPGRSTCAPAGPPGRWSRHASRCSASRHESRVRRCGPGQAARREPSFGRKLFIEAQASNSVPSTEKCSHDSSGLTSGAASTAWPELPRDVALQQPVAVLGEHRHVPDRRIHRQADEPAKQHVVGDLLHQLAFRPHRVECLQQQRPQQLLRRDRIPTASSVQRVELSRQPLQRRVHQRPDRRSGWPAVPSPPGSGS